MHFSSADREKVARTLHPSNCQEPLANRRSQQVDLELSRHNVAVGRRLGQRRISAGTVGNTRYCASVDITVLLAKPFREWQSDVHLTVGHGGQPRSQTSPSDFER